MKQSTKISSSSYFFFILLSAIVIPLKLMRSFFVFFLFTNLLFAMKGVAATGPAPSPYEDNGACPFECCTYREWETREDVSLLTDPKVDASVISKIPKLTKVRAITGKVVTTRPGQFRVTVGRQSYKNNDIIYIYTYLGEGVYRTWYKGEMLDLDLGCCSDGSIPNCYTKNDIDCWGKIIINPVSTWWAQIETVDRHVGWTKDTDKFDNQDSCG